MINLLIYITLAVLLISCKPQKQENIIVNFNEKVVITGHEQRNVGRNGNAVYIKVEKIQDNRCPPEGICFWEGFVNVEFLLSNHKDKTSFALCLGSCKIINKTSSVYVVLGSESYKITLLEVGETVSVKIEKI